MQLHDISISISFIALLRVSVCFYAAHLQTLVEEDSLRWRRACSWGRCSTAATGTWAVRNTAPRAGRRGREGRGKDRERGERGGRGGRWRRGGEGEGEGEGEEEREKGEREGREREKGRERERRKGRKSGKRAS